MSRVIRFEIPVDDSDRALKFYSSVFGWNMEKAGPLEYWFTTTGPDEEPGINGAFAKRDSTMEGTTNTISVSSLDDALKKITQAGGRAATPKTTIEGIGYFAYCRDTEGNLFGIVQPDRSAK